MWTNRFLCVLQAGVPLIQWMCELSMLIVDGVDMTVKTMLKLTVTLLNRWTQLQKSETADCYKGEDNAENLQASGQVVQDSIPDEIFQRIKLGMHGNDLKLVEQRTESLLQAGSNGSPGGEQVGNLAAGSDAQALGGLTKQNFHGARHAQC